MRSTLILAALGTFLFAIVGCGPETYEVEVPEYHDPPVAQDEPLADDSLDTKSPPFDDAIVDSRPLGDWQVNASAAVIRLDCPAIKPGEENGLLVLHKSYSDAFYRTADYGREWLPSANLLDGAAKQFDDGLYAAVDLACYRGDLGLVPGSPDVIQAIFEKLPAGGPARPFLAAALELADRKMPLSSNEESQKQGLLQAFDRAKVRSKPIGFYDWTPELSKVFRFYRFLQCEFDENNVEACRAVAAVLAADASMLARYRSISGFYGRLTNSMICLSADVLSGAKGDLKSLAAEQGFRRATVAVFPPSTSRETELFERIFPSDVPSNVNLMSMLVRRIRSGEVDLKPSAKDGWYQYQVYALETMLLPTRGREGEKLLLTASYKKRLVEAFKALVTKRRETHVRHEAKAACAMPRSLGGGDLRPRLRLEPCPTFYLRTARAYGFVQNLLLAAAGKECLGKLHGLKEKGLREPCLADELEAIRRRFYGFYLISCEDIGMKPGLLKDEPVDQNAVMQAAIAWLGDIKKDADLACDTRVAVPIYVEPDGPVRFWATVGVRFAPLDVKYARPPKVRPKSAEGAWQDPDTHVMGESRYLIPIDEFAEFELPASSALSRGELREICDQYNTKEAILQALSRMR